MDLGAAAITGSDSLNEAMCRLGPAYSGSCALVSYYHSESQLLKVACTGDSRASLADVMLQVNGKQKLSPATK